MTTLLSGGDSRLPAFWLKSGGAGAAESAAAWYFPAGTRDVYSFCVWAWSPFRAEWWPPSVCAVEEINTDTPAGQGLASGNSAAPTSSYHRERFIKSLWCGTLISDCSYSSIVTATDHSLPPCVEQTNQPADCRHSLCSPPVRSTNRGLRGKGCVCLTRWSFLGFFHVPEWLQLSAQQPSGGGTSQRIVFLMESLPGNHTGTLPGFLFHNESKENLQVRQVSQD